MAMVARMNGHETPIAPEAAAAITAALDCGDCAADMDRHLVRCRPMSCLVVEAFVSAGPAGRTAAMGAMLTASPEAHEARRCRCSPGTGIKG